MAATSPSTSRRRRSHSMPTEAQDPARLKQLVAAAMKDYLGTQTEIGVSAAVAVGDVRAHYVAGLSDREANQPVSEDTLFLIGSVQKVFTNTLAAARIVEGKLALTDQITRFLPGEVRQQGTVIRQVTPQALGTMTAGMPSANVPGHPAGALYRGEVPPPAMFDFWTRFNPETRVGAHYSYSNVSEVTQGFTTTFAARRSYPELFATDIQEPLAMRDTRVDLTGIRPERIAQGYTTQGKRLGYRGVGFNSTASDMLRFLEGNLFRVPSMPLLTYRAMKLAHTPHFEISARQSIGLGWYITDAPGGAKVVSKAGGNGGFVAWVGFLPGHAAAVVLLTNGHPTTGLSLPATGRKILLEAAGLDTSEVLPDTDADAGIQPEEDAAA
ncbi:hypothetical protein D7Y13_08460 [Corallococcus praedator]|uniref:Beta-lactamase-related domain-containing protein n=2 Tax=Myxococcaceae TaxID=31 RepID=A0ABX9QMB2_9BACT|nr:hypothetical protein D7X75_09210 [Corallococcus sp. CA031C]RKI12957.1 hypothetical protein D7Y13_08460 [Corallococcus praedator]